MWWVGCLWLSLKFGGVVLCNCNCICSRTSRWNLHIDLKVLFLCFDSSLPHQGPQSRNLHSKLVFIFLEGSENATPRSVGHDKHASRFWLLGLHLPTNLLATSKQQPTGILLHLALFSLRWQFWQAFVTFLSGSDLQHCKIKAIGNLQSVVEPRSLQAVLLLNFSNFLRKLFVSQLGLRVLSLVAFCLPHLHHFEPQFAPKLLSKPLCISAQVWSFSWAQIFKRSLFACYNQHGFSTVQMSNLACISPKDLSLLWDHLQ